MVKLRAGILGATGAVGQNCILLLQNHDWFELTYLAASPKSAGRRFREAVEGRWIMQRDIPKNIEDLVLGNVHDLKEALEKCDFVFSAVELPTKEEVKELEMRYAQAGIPVVSNNSAHRFTEDVPMIIPEINPAHLNIIPVQRKNYGLDKGFIVVKPNCSIQSFMAPIHALMSEGYFPRRLIVSTEQALSGAGYPGISSLAISNNTIPYIQGEDEKTEKEPLKILGQVKNKVIVNYQGLDISATCTRVPVRDGHTAIVNLEFYKRKPSIEEILQIWNRYVSLPQEMSLPSAPRCPIIYRDEVDRPQPIIDIYAENGMAVTAGRLRKCDVLDIKFVGLSHNTIRGAAGGAILTAELLLKQGYL
ncbi:aspartate-semialdehyde dehydrogenase [Candidatus Pacearchaeota archaeon]|nr:aspartate-semialdehyde dehydrogenase [Candidatus Pacearchaeota archaeon]